MNITEVVHRWPHLTSPAALMKEDNPSYSLPPHLDMMNRMAMEVSFNVQSGKDGVRKIINLPFGHAKSSLWSHYWPAWNLIWFPDTRIILVGHGEEFASEFGGKVRDTIRRYGKEMGISLRADKKAQGNWQIEGHKGGMVCLGPKGGTIGRHADIFLVDDLLKGYEDALSPTILDNLWAFFETTVISRLRREVSLVMVGTRWVKNDVFGRVLSRYRGTPEEAKWEVYRLKALAEKDDPLGRKEGEPLWPEQYTREQLETEKKKNRWFRAAWQQEPTDETGSYFRPSLWPRYHDKGGVYSLGGRSMVEKSSLIVLTTVDWAASEKKTSDFTCIGTFGITPRGEMLVLDVVFERVSVEKCVPLLARVCNVWHPDAVAVEVGGFQSALASQCKDFPQIPGSVIQMHPEGKSKLARALPAITMGDAGRIYLPPLENEPPWLEEFERQLIEFDGITEGEHDDAVDVVSMAAKRSSWLYRGNQVSQPPCLLVEGFNPQ